MSQREQGQAGKAELWTAQGGKGLAVYVWGFGGIGRFRCWGMVVQKGVGIWWYMKV